jgi:hypothetical protein
MVLFASKLRISFVLVVRIFWTNFCGDYLLLLCISGTRGVKSLNFWNSVFYIWIDLGLFKDGRLFLIFLSGTVGMGGILGALTILGVSYKKSAGPLISFVCYLEESLALNIFSFCDSFLLRSFCWVGNNGTFGGWTPCSYLWLLTYCSS